MPVRVRQCPSVSIRGWQIQFYASTEGPEFKAFLKTARSPAAGDFGRSRGGEDRASPQRAAHANPCPSVSICGWQIQFFASTEAPEFLTAKHAKHAKMLSDPVSL